VLVERCPDGGSIADIGLQMGEGGESNVCAALPCA
jgi:hypothetical protein